MHCRFRPAGLAALVVSSVLLLPTEPRAESAATVAAASKALAAKNEACRNEARQKRLHFVKRKVFMHRCIHG